MSHSDKAGRVGPAAGRRTVKVGDVMTHEVISVSPDADFPEIVDCLYTNGISGVPVVAADGSLLGVVTEADLITKEAYHDGTRRHLGIMRDHLAGRDPAWIRKSAARTASDLMSTHVATAHPDDDLGVAARRMLEGHHKRLPVIADGRLVGIVSRHDLLQPFHRSDAEIAGDIDELLADPLRAPEAHQARAEVAKGIVTLEGSTRWPSDVHALEAMIAWVPGVVAVTNKLTAREPDVKLESRYRLGITGP